VPFAAARFFGAGLRLEVVPDDRVREVELPFPPERLREGVLLLRDAGGEDVRVAMIGIYPVNPICPLRYTRAPGKCTTKTATQKPLRPHKCSRSVG
jgi:hypothetical protein